MKALRVVAPGAFITVVLFWLWTPGTGPTARLSADPSPVVPPAAVRSDSQPQPQPAPRRRPQLPALERREDPTLFSWSVANPVLPPLPALPPGYEPDDDYEDNDERAGEPIYGDNRDDTPAEPASLLLPVNSGDDDNDGIPGYADGFDLDGRAGTDDDTDLAAVPNTRFGTVQLHLGAHADPATARVTFRYQASDPSALRPQVLPPGALRLWTREQSALRTVRANDDRKPRPGTFIGAGSFDAARLGLLPQQPVMLFVEAVRPSTSANDLSLTIEVESRVGAITFWARRTLPITAVNVDLLADCNRDGRITASDDRGEADWNSGQRTRGALVLLNCDRDRIDQEDPDDIGAPPGPPDNWPGGDWDEDGEIISREQPDRIINNREDLADITRIHLQSIDAVRGLPGVTATLMVRPVLGEDAYFHNFQEPRTGTFAWERLRVFLPRRVNPRGMVRELASGDESIIGPEHVRVFARFGAGADCDHVMDDLHGPGGVQLGVEGIEPGAFVDLVWTIELHGLPVGRDVLRLRVTPLVLNDHRQPALRDRPGTPSVIVADDGPGNAMLRNQLTEHFGFRRVAQVADSGDTWHQDGYEVAYARSPIGAMPVVLELPRGDSGLNEFVRHEMLRPGIGVCTRIARMDAGELQDYGGNIETLPDGRGPADAVIGAGMSEPLASFFRAQAVNRIRTVRVHWLWVGHVDEVLSASPDDHVLLADPEAAWALLVWIAANHPDTTIPGEWCGAADVDDRVTLGMAMQGGHLRELRRFNIEFMAGPQALGQVASRLELPSAVSPVVASGTNVGTARLERAGALPGFMPGVRSPRAITVEFVARKKYRVFYLDNATGREMDAGEATTDDDATFPVAGCFVLHHWWSGAAEAGDRFTFEVDPDCRLLGLPVLFDEQDHHEGAALTNNPVNCLVDGRTVFAAHVHEPTCPSPDGDDDSDLFNDYNRAVFHRAGFRKVYLADDRNYHLGNGGIHCGTNMIRALPSVPWWENPPAVADANHNPVGDARDRRELDPDEEDEWDANGRNGGNDDGEIDPRKSDEDDDQ